MHRTYGCPANPDRCRPQCHLCGKDFSQPHKLKAHIHQEHGSTDFENCGEAHIHSSFARLNGRKFRGQLVHLLPHWDKFSLFTRVKTTARAWAVRREALTTRAKRVPTSSVVALPCAVTWARCTAKAPPAPVFATSAANSSRPSPTSRSTSSRIRAWNPSSKSTHNLKKSTFKGSFQAPHFHHQVWKDIFPVYLLSS